MEKEQNNLLVSIVTVSYNSARTIRDTIESVLHQTYTKIEYLIIDGASTDDTVQIAKEYQSAFEDKGYTYTIISEPDQGIYDAMNKGIKMAHGDLIGIINSDDWYENNAIKRVVDTYEKTRFDMFYADLRIVTEQPDGSCKEYMIKRSKVRNYMVSRDWNHPTTFLTKEMYGKYQYKLESLHDDWDLVLRVKKSGAKIVVLNEVLANFRMGGASNDKSLKKCISRGKARYRIYRNNGYSRWYWVECVAIEVVKFILTK